MNYIAITLSRLLVLIPPILGLLWIMKLKKESCLCSEKWMREYINYYFIFIISFFAITLIPLFSIDKIYMYRPVSMILALYYISSYFTIVYYIYNLKKNDCKCSESKKREIIYVWYIIQCIFAIISIPLFIYLYFMFNGNKLYK